MAATLRSHAKLFKSVGISITSNPFPFDSSNTGFKSLFSASSRRSTHSNPTKFMCENMTNLDDIYEYFDELLVQRPLARYNQFEHVLNIVTNKLKLYSASLHMFNQMCAANVPHVDRCTLDASVIKCYSGLYDTKKLYMVLGFCFRRDIEVCPFHYSRILEEFIRGETTHEAEKLFKKFIKHNLCETNHVNHTSYAYYTMHEMIKGLCKIGNHFKAIGLLRLMEGRSNSKCIPYAILESLCKDMMIDDAFILFKEISKVYNDERITLVPDILMIDYLLYALSMSGRWDEVCRFLKQLQEQGKTSMSAFNILIKALCKHGKMNEAERVLFIKVHSGRYYRDIETYTSFIDGYCLIGDMNKAMSTFQESIMGHDDVKATVYIYIYNRLLDGFTSLDVMNFWSYKRNLDSMYVWAGWEMIENSVTRYIWYRERMEKLPFTEMKSIPRISVYMLCLMDHYDKYEVDDALDLFYFMDGKELNSNIDVYNIVIDCTRICGRFDISRRLFHDLFVKGLEPNLDTYMFMIRGYCDGGLLKDAKKLFLKMEEGGWLRQPRSSINDEDIIQDYTETTPIDDVTKLFIETKRRGYSKRVDECFKFVTEYFKPI